jgi:GNAT superfamily N-acetyltransferase
LELAAVAASSNGKHDLLLRIIPMVSAGLRGHFVEPALHARTNESALYPGPSELLTLQANGKPDISLFLRPVRSSDGAALQNYVRGLSPRSRFNRFLGAASELPASELARALAANGHDTLTLLVTSKLAARETVVGEARVALSCAERAGEFGMSIADDWRHLGAGSAVLQAIERKAAADGIEFLFGDTLRTNEAMIGLALGRGFRLEPGLEPRLVRIRKRLDDAAPDVPCLKWSEIADGVEHRTT